MFVSSTFLRRGLIHSTAIVAASLLVCPSSVQADSIVINTTRTSSVGLRDGDDLTITPAGSIRIGSLRRGRTPYAVFVGSSATAAFITNNGAIDVNHIGSTSRGFAAGIYLSSAGVSGALTNNGSINADSLYTGWGYLYAQAAGVLIGYGATNNIGFVGQFNNTGTVTGHATAQSSSSWSPYAAAYGYGLNFTYDNAQDGSIGSFSNTGTISGEATATAAASSWWTSYGATAHAHAVGVNINNGSIGNRRRDVTSFATDTVVLAFINKGTIEATAYATGSYCSSTWGSCTSSQPGGAFSSAIGVNVSHGTIHGGVLNAKDIIATASSTVFGRRNYRGKDPSIFAAGFSLDSSSVFGSFNNEGTISGQATPGGALQLDLKTEAGSAEAHGVLLSSSSTITGNFSNSGTISGEAAAAYSASGSGGGLAKAGGVLLSQSFISGTFSNEGTISAKVTTLQSSSRGGSAGGHAAGFDVSNSLVSGLITNSGDIQAVAERTITRLRRGGAVALTKWGASVSAYGAHVHGSSISGATFSSNRYYGGLLSGGLTNTGTLTAVSTLEVRDVVVDLKAEAVGSYGKSSSPDVIGYGLLLSSGGDIAGAGVTNTGAISGRAHADYRAARGVGVMVLSGADISGGIHNNGGEISGTASGSTVSNFGVYVSNAAITGGITNNGGTIKGGTLGVKVEDNGFLSSFDERDETYGAAIYMNRLQGLTPITLNGGRVIGDIHGVNYKDNNWSFTNVTGDFYTEGNFYVSRIDVSDGAKFTISAGDVVTAGRMNDDIGSRALPSRVPVIEGTYNFEIDSADERTGGFGKLVVDGGGIDLTNASVSAKVRLGNISDGDKFRVGTGDVTLIGTDGGEYQLETSITDNSHLWSFKMADGSQPIVAGAINQKDVSGDTELWLIVEQDNFVNNSATTGNAGIGNVIPDLNGDPDPVVQQILIALNSAPTAAALNDVLEALQADHSMGTVMSSLGITATVNALLSTQLSELRTGSGVSGMSAGDRRNTSDGLRVWGQGFGTAAEQSVREGISGYDSDTFGAAFGVDTAQVPNTVLGLALSYANTDVDSDATNKAHTKINSYQVTAYGSHYYARPDIFVNGMLAYSHHKNDTSRIPLPGLKANGDFNAKQYSATLTVGRDYRRGDMMLTPMGSLNWSHYNPDDYIETGAGAANLSIQGKKVALFELGVGLDATWFMGSGDLHIDPTLSVGYSYDVIGDNMEMVSSLQAGGASFKTEGFDPAQHKFNVGFGVNIYSNAVWEFKAEYDYNVKSDFHSHSGLLRVGYNF